MGETAAARPAHVIHRVALAAGIKVIVVVIIGFSFTVVGYPYANNDEVDRHEYCSKHDSLLSFRC
jgi:hypothetical protein